MTNAPTPAGRLEPCPFCGNRPDTQSFWYAAAPGDEPRGYYVFCLECSDTAALDGPRRDRLDDAIAAWNRRPAAQPSAGAEPFQARVLPWLMECFGADIAADIEERCDRFIEEALEQVQSLGWAKERALALVDYVYGRPAGEPHQEAGGVMVTFAALCQAAGLNMTKAGEDELARIMRPEIVLKIRAKQAAKPTGSALPVAALAPVAAEVPVGAKRPTPRRSD